MTIDSWGLVLLLLVLLAWRIWMRWWCQPGQDRPAAAAQLQRLLKPRTPHDCPACRQAPAAPVDRLPLHPSITPWREIKSRRGAPKRIDTTGFACPKPTCSYYRVTDAQIHALVGDGLEGKTERIQTLRCQACGISFSARHDTPLYRLKTSSQRVAEVLTALAEGLSVAAAVRVFGHRRATITTWLTRAGVYSATLHDRVFQRLHLSHIQFDELRTRLRNRAHAWWLWPAIDSLTKIIPVLHHPEGTRRADPGRRSCSGPRSAWTIGHR